jgi:N-acetylneuraminic acid mutarotase
VKPSRQRAFHLPGFLALCALTCSPALLADLNNGLVAWYPFDGNASDMSGNNNHGTVNGATLGTDRHGAAGKAYAFDGVNDFIDMGDKTAFDGRPSQSIFLWINFSSLGGSTNQNGLPIFSKWFTSSQTGRTSYLVNEEGGVLNILFSNGTSGDGTSVSHGLGLQSWHHLGTVFEQGDLKVFSNGNQIHQSSLGISEINDSTEQLRIGGWYQTYTPTHKTFNGSIDDVRIYDRALSAAEVAELYALESTLPAGSVTLDKLAPELSDLLDGNGTIEQALPAGSVIAVKPGDPAPVGYTLFQRNEYNASLTWEEMAPVSVARYAADGVDALNGKIYFVGGWNSSVQNLVERYDPATNQWETLSPMTVTRTGVATAVLNGKLYAIGGEGLSSVEIFDPQTGQWSTGPALPSVLHRTTAITVDGKIILVGGRNSAGQDLGQVLELDPNTSQWTQKAAMPTARFGAKLVFVDGKVWAIGGESQLGKSNKVEIYDFVANSWTTGTSLTTTRNWPLAWEANGRIYAAGGQNLNSIEFYDPATNQWITGGSLPENKFCADATVLDGKVYLVAGQRNDTSWSNKVFAADLPPPAMDLYFRDGNATAGAATSPALDGNLTITLNMLAPDALAKLDASQTHAQSAGSVIAVPKDSAPPAGYSLYKRSDRNSSLVWEEKAPVSMQKHVFDGVEVLDGKIYCVGGFDGSIARNVAERYDPATNQWETLNPLATAREGVATAVLDGKLYAIGGKDLASVEIFDPQTGQWTSGPSLPSAVSHAPAIAIGGKIYLIGGFSLNFTSQLNQVLEFDPSTNQWSQKTPMPTAHNAHKLVHRDGKIWAIGGHSGDTHLSIVEIYDLATDSWTTGPSLSSARGWPFAWVSNGKIYIGGGHNNASFLNTIEVWDPATNQWSSAGLLPENKLSADSVVLDGKIYVVAGGRNNGDYSAKVFAADITPPMDLYFRDANASGTVTLDKLAGTVVSKLDGNASAEAPIGAVSAIDHNDQAPTDHTVLERTDRNATHVWEEKASVSVARAVHGGVKVLNGKIYLVGGFDGTPKDIAERYDPDTNQWETLTSMSVAREGLSAAVLNGKLYAIGGQNLSSVEMYDPQTGQWSAGQALPTSVFVGSAIATRGKILLIGGKNPSGQNLDQVLEFDPATNQWSQKAPMPTARHAINLVRFEDKIWAIGGMDASRSKKVEIYDTATNSWTTGPPLTIARSHLSAWLGNGRIYVAGGIGGSLLKSIEAYDPASNQWTLAGNLPENKHATDAAVLNGKIYLGAGQTDIYNYSDKVFAADLIPHRDLYFQEANATAPTQPAPNQAPVFSGGTATFTTPENNASASFIIGATDPDANVLTYVKTGPDADKFTLNGNTGELTFNTAPDYEANASAASNNTYQVTITVSDGEASSTQSVTVNVTDDPADNPIDLTQGLVAWYPFDGNASDMSGNGNHGTVHGATPGADRHGRTGKAYSFDGVDDYIRIANSPSLNPSALSIALWFKGTESFAGAGSNVLIHKPYTSHVSPFYQWHFHIGGDEYHTHLGKFQFGIWANGSGLGSGNLNTTEILNHWRFMTGVVDPVSQTASFFLDGVKTLTSPSPWNGTEIPSYETDVFIAKHGNLNNEIHYTPGCIDEIRIYNRALSAAEVQSLYQLESTPPTDNNQTGTNPPVDNNNTNPPVDGNQTQTDQNATAPAPGDPAPTLFRPLPKTLAREELGNSNFRLWGQVLADGGSPVTGVAFELADNMVFRNSTLHSASLFPGSPNFFGEFTLEPGKRYYYRAVATNAIGTTFGSPKKLTTPPSQARWWTNAPEISGGWRNSPWLGTFRPYDNGWVYHAKLGWAYAHPDGSGGLWIWFRDHHWTWTQQGVFPYLWKHDLGTWYYLLGTRDGQPVFYEWTESPQGSGTGN